MLVFDKTSRDSFENIRNWLEEINKFSENSSRIVVGNKDDSKDLCQVDFDTANKYAEELKMNYIETSALNSHQVTTAFETIARELMQKKDIITKKGEKLTLPQGKQAAANCC